MSTTFRYRYPGDPVDECVVMSRQEFLRAYPREPIRIYSGLEVEEIPLSSDQINCDACNDDPGQTIYVIRNGTRAYCWQCAERYIVRYREDRN